MTSVDSRPDAPSTPPIPSARRWWILAALSIAQLMVVLDSTIVNIALPVAQQDLGFDDGGRQWVITAYSLAFGSLLLIGGRVNDLFGRKNSFVIGLIGFAGASALGGWAPTFEVLVGARALQGVFAALLAPAALSLLTVTFAGSRDRGKAFGIFGAVAGAGAAVGLLLGGVLTEYLSWRWCLYVNVVFAGVALVGALLLFPRHVKEEHAKGLDWLGAAVVTAGLFLLVYGFSHSETNGWDDPLTIGFLAAGVALLALFVMVQRSVAHPLLPLRVLLDRVRAASYLIMLISAVGLFGVSLFLTFYLQQSLGFSPVVTGVAFLPMTVAIALAASITGSVLTTRVSPRITATAGMLLGAAGMASLTLIGTDSSYVSHVLPGLILVGLGLGLIFANGMGFATIGVDNADAGVASATVNTAQQIGGAIGIALLSSVSAAAATSFATESGPSADLAEAAAIAGFQSAFWWAAGFFLVGALVAGVLYENRIPRSEPGADPVLVH
ncbi:MFS transporter [Rhodococcus triatomae]|uniref:Drug resistance transporter, EmrB/QacA subfamily n=1 Tax=Rhodococcus triatomae TaxID=300028 RepID=A0A1G8H4G4_9NOCA|nr:MFS transporter [Rhodococcus triatomae]QNG20209.1 MFS transporter [Rhodococcus triatomae]QNG23876.1 MFS transporter [Rhodococcus triatomae]SDI01537.1 drug resistance transporter, EmrB/QacA subfamily [Rhodococcus triatomae]